MSQTKCRQISYNTYVRFIVSSFANRFGFGSLSKSIRLLLEGHGCFLAVVVAKEERSRRGEWEEKKKGKKGRSREEARFTGGVSRRPPFPCTREFNRGWNVLHLLRVSFLRIAASIPVGTRSSQQSRIRIAVLVEGWKGVAQLSARWVKARI